MEETRRRENQKWATQRRMDLVKYQSVTLDRKGIASQEADWSIGAVGICFRKDKKGPAVGVWGFAERDTWPISICRVRN